MDNIEEKEPRDPKREIKVGLITMVLIAGIVLLFVGPFKIFNKDENNTVLEEKDLLCTKETNYQNQYIRDNVRITFNSQEIIEQATITKLMRWHEDEANILYEEFKNSYAIMSDIEKNALGYVGTTNYDDILKEVKFTNSNAKLEIDKLSYNTYEEYKGYYINQSYNCYP